MTQKKQDNFSLYSKYDKIGLILLLVGGIGFIYDNSLSFTHWLYADLEHLYQPHLLPNYLGYTFMIMTGIGIFLTFRMF